MVSAQILRDRMMESCGVYTHSCWFATTSMELPSGSIAPSYVHGPLRDGAEAMAMFPSVEKRNHVPSDLLMTLGS